MMRHSVRNYILIILFAFLLELGIILFTTIMITESQKTDGLVINLSGRQRMLTQKMTKEVLTYIIYFNEKNQNLDKIKNNIKNTMKLFESTLYALKDGGKASIDLEMKNFRECPKPENKQIVSQLEKVVRLWNMFKSNLNFVISSNNIHKEAVDYIINNNLPLLKEMNKVVLLFQKESEYKVNLLIMIQLILAILGIVIIILSMIFVNSKMIVPLIKLKDALIKASNGDLTETVDINNKDEIGELSKHYNKFIVAFKQILLRIKEITQKMENISNTFVDDINNLSQRTINDSASLEETSSATEEITATISNTADKVNEFYTIIKEVNEMSNNNRVMIEESVNIMKRAQESTDSIRKITDLVSDIAFQTNLLAINAAIEAARAGNAGKGFAVVSTEIRKLAQRTADAVGDITNLIDKSTSLIDSGNVKVRKTAEVIIKSVELMSKVNIIINEIVNAINEQSIGVKEINQGMSQLVVSTQENGKLVENTLQLSEELRTEAISLREQIKIFKF